MMEQKQLIGADRGWPFAAGGSATIALASLLWAFSGWLRSRRPHVLTSLLFIAASSLLGLILYFFRDPNRRPVTSPELVLSPGDGEVVTITEEDEQEYLHRRCLRISIFLSVFDVHVQRAPVSGQVRIVVHKPGQFLQAFRPEASELNEHIAMVIDSAHGPVLVKQIAGILARRCVNYVSAGDTLEAGQRFGLIRFGSRVDLYLPAEAECIVAIGDKVYGGISTLARFDEVPADE